MTTTAAKTAELIKLRNILYPTDFSEPSEMALPFATALARRYGASVHALNVITPNAFAASTPELAGMALETEREMAFESLRQLDSQLAGLNHETIVERALSVWDGVSQAIEDCSADIIVLGTHGRTGAQLYSETYHEEALYPSTQNTPALSSYFELMDKVLSARKLVGTVLDPYAAYALGRGLKTLSVRVERQNATALAVARAVEQRGRVERVYYPGLESHPDHASAKKQMRGFGGMLCLDLGGG